MRKFAFVFLLATLPACVPPSREPRLSVPSTAPDELLEQQRSRVQKDPRPAEVRKLVALLVTAGELNEALKWIHQTPDLKDDPLIQLLAGYATSDLVVDVRLCARFRGYRQYERCPEAKFAPGARVLLYVEVENFALVRNSMHLRYDWELFDDRGKKLSIPEWEHAPSSEKEDQVTFQGRVSAFAQSFGLPLPENIAGGAYTIRIAVTDELSEKKSRAVVNVPIEVAYK